MFIFSANLLQVWIQLKGLKILDTFKLIPTFSLENTINSHGKTFCAIAILLHFLPCTMYGKFLIILFQPFTSLAILPPTHPLVRNSTELFSDVQYTRQNSSSEKGLENEVNMWGRERLKSSAWQLQTLKH